jgi:hypothetical protein
VETTISTHTDNQEKKMRILMSKNKHTRRAWVAVLAAVLGAAAGGSAGAGPVVYVVDAENEFGTLDLSSGAFTLLGDFPPGTGRHGPFPIVGLGFSGPGQLSAIDSKGNVFAVDPTNAAVTPLFSSGTFPNGGGGDGHGILYAFDMVTGNVDALNVTNGTVKTITNFPSTQSTGFTAVGPDGSLYITVLNTNPGGAFDDLYRINPLTGAITDLGSDLNNLYAGVFVGSTLYGFSPYGGIYTINTTTGQETFMGAYSLPSGDAIYAAAFQGQSVPEPSSLILLGGGAVCMAGFAARSRR